MTSLSECSSSPLLSLPVEIRCAIIRYVVVEPYPLCMHIVEDDSNLDELRIHYYSWSGRPELASVCSLMRDEVLPIYYAENSFRLGIETNDPGETATGTIERWQNRLGENSQDVRDVAVSSEIALKDKYGGHNEKLWMEVRAAFCNDGSIYISRRAETGQSLCVCDLDTATGDRRYEPKNGERILAILDSRIENKDLVLKIPSCEGCKQRKLDIEEVQSDEDTESDEGNESDEELDLDSDVE